MLLAIVGSLFVLMRRRRLQYQTLNNRKGLSEHQESCQRRHIPDHKKGRLPKTLQAHTVCLKKDSQIKINNENNIGTITSESTFTGIIMKPPQYDDTGKTCTSDRPPHPPSYSHNGYVNVPQKLTDMTVK